MKISIVDFDFSDHRIEEELCARAGIDLFVHDGRCSADDMVLHAQGADAIITSYGDVTRDVIAALAPRLKVVSRTGVGVDNIDIQAATDYGVAVCNVPGYGTEVVSDHAIALALACLRQIAQQDADIRKGIWNYERTKPLGQCKGRRFGVIGMGAIGRAVARKAAGLGFEVACWSRSLEPLAQRRERIPLEEGAFAQCVSKSRQEGEKGTGSGFSDVKKHDAAQGECALGAASARGTCMVLPLDELFATCDVVSLHTALTPETHHLVTQERIASMKRAAIIVNTSRGAVVDTVALAQALQEGRLWGAGLDVFEDEPLSADHPILAAPRTVLTPHAAYWSEESGVELRTRACQSAIEALQGGKPKDCLNPEVFAKAGQ